MANETIQLHDTHVIGRFTCTNAACSSTGWESKMVAILIRGYVGNGYNAEVFSQCCETCKEFGSLELNVRSYVERVAYRIQKWAGIPMEAPYYGGKSGLPHKEDLCEGCRRGICRRRDVLLLR